LKYENENKEIKEILNETINKCDEEKVNILINIFSLIIFS